MCSNTVFRVWYITWITAKTLRCASYFQLSSLCLEVRSSIVCVWCITWITLKILRCTLYFRLFSRCLEKLSYSYSFSNDHSSLFFFFFLIFYILLKIFLDFLTERIFDVDSASGVNVLCSGSSIWSTTARGFVVCYRKNLFEEVCSISSYQECRIFSNYVSASSNI